MWFMVDLCRASLVWEKSLPSLRCLTITISTHTDTGRAQDLASNTSNYSPIRTAQLAELTLTLAWGYALHDDYAAAVISLAGTIPFLISHSLQQLDALSIVAEDAERLCDADFSSLTRLAHRVQIKDEYTGDIIVDLLDGDVYTAPSSDSRD